VEMEKEEKKSITIKVRPDTYRRLKLYQAKMVLQSNGERSYTMDDVINAMLNLIEIAFKEAEEEEEQESEESSGS